LFSLSGFDFLLVRKTDRLKPVLLKAKTQLLLAFRWTSGIEGTDTEAVFLTKRGYSSGNFPAIGFWRIGRVGEPFAVPPR
jgi:hypothetical protein